MKRTAAAFVILCVIIIYSVSAIFIIRHENSRIVSVLDEIQYGLDSGDTDSAAKSAERLENLWFGYERRMSLFVNDTKLAELNTSIAKVRPYCEEANDELEAELQNIRHRLELIFKAEIPFWYNII